jgi:hypothetical protein
MSSTQMRNEHATPMPGGHFAAWEQPELFAAELHAAFKSLREAR